MTDVETISLYEILPKNIDLDISNETYIREEQGKINPALRELGYQIGAHGWYTTERDSFGPLGRAIRAVKDGKKYIIVYG